MLRLSDIRYEEIKEIITNICTKFDIRCVPINSFEVAQKMGISMIPYPKKNYDALVATSQDGFVVWTKKQIYYNPKQESYERLNNTIMHEIGHIALGHKQESEIAEAEVKFFAKYFLAPPVLIHKLQLSSAEDIARVFNISKEASQIAWDYYKKWLNYSGRFYKPYEIKLIDLFQNSIGEYLQSNKYPVQ